MLKVIDKLSRLKFSDLMRVYEENNLLTGREQYPRLSEANQLREAEQDFYEYLRSVFFRQKDARYAVWEEQNRYISAVRLEPYSDGVLLCALETAPDYRRKGYGELMIRALQSYLQGMKIYSHVAKSNTASVELHKKCGFQIMKDYAVHMDGSVFHDSVTMVYECEKTESE